MKLEFTLRDLFHRLGVPQETIDYFHRGGNTLVTECDGTNVFQITCYPEDENEEVLTIVISPKTEDPTYHIDSGKLLFNKIDIFSFRSFLSLFFFSESESESDIPSFKIQCNSL